MPDHDAVPAVYEIHAHRPEPITPSTPPEPDQPDTVPDPTREPTDPDTPAIGDPPSQPSQTPHTSAHDAAAGILTFSFSESRGATGFRAPNAINGPALCTRYKTAELFTGNLRSSA